MRIHTDLHAHSAFAGGARAGGRNPAEQEKKIIKRFHDSALYSPLKGVNLIGTGDIQFGPWMEFIRSKFEEDQGIYSYNDIKTIPENSIVPDGHTYEVPRYILQSEYIVTGPIPGSKKKKRVHLLALFPDFVAVEELLAKFDQWEVSHENMARPFIVCDTQDEVAQKMYDIQDIHPLIELIPAHVMTPEGVYGGNGRINFLSDFFGEAEEHIHAVETGLSADPTILGVIPELDNRTLLSNADAHSANLNRVGREFTTLEVGSMDYKGIIEAIRQGKVEKTAEFHPTEGRYFLTGHRAGRTMPGKHGKAQFCCFSPAKVPENDLCPQCGKELTIGVLQRALEVSHAQGADRKIGEGPQRPYVTMVPMIEILAKSLGIKSLTAKSLLKAYSGVLEVIGTEVNLWTDPTMLKKLEQSSVDPRVVDSISKIYEGDFCFVPGGYDGVYGELQIGQQLDYMDISIMQD
ncbi:MAG: endonuclease Q family protein [Candidatus Kariarchaeaceae archaeon]|jgi:PHP family Zn ribbon phosphoesterase